MLFSSSPPPSLPPSHVIHLSPFILTIGSIHRTRLTSPTAKPESEQIAHVLNSATGFWCWHRCRCSSSWKGTRTNLRRKICCKLNQLMSFVCARLLRCGRASCEVLASHVDDIKWFIIENNTSMFRQHNLLQTPYGSNADSRHQVNVNLNDRRQRARENKVNFWIGSLVRWRGKYEIEK